MIEVDGPVHDNSEAKFNDSVRSKAIEKFNIEVMRFTNLTFSHFEDIPLKGLGGDFPLKGARGYPDRFRKNLARI